MKTPLVGLDWYGDKTFAYFLEEKLQQKCKEYEELLVNKETNTKPEYLFLKTKNGESFGIVVHKEQRLNKPSLLHKKGYKSRRVSYNLNELDDEFVHWALRTTISKMNVRNFTKIEAYSLKEDCELVQVAEFSYFVSEDKHGKEAYIDGVHVKKDYRGLDISRALQDYAHLRFAKEGVDVVTADLMKIDIDYASETLDPYRDPYTPYFNMLVGNPRERVFRGEIIRTKETDSYGYEVESKKKMHDHWIGVTPVRAEMKNIKLNPDVIIPKDEFIKNQGEDVSIM